MDKIKEVLSHSCVMDNPLNVKIPELAFSILPVDFFRSFSGNH